MAWIFLVVAGLLEIVWAYAMKLSDGFTKWQYSAVTLVAMGLNGNDLAVEFHMA